MTPHNADQVAAGDGRRGRVLIWGTYDTSKPRTRILRAGLAATGVEVDEIHSPVWEGVEDKSQVRSRTARARLLLRWLLSYPGLAWRLLRAPRADLVLVGYPGLLDILVAVPIARLRRLPLVWDMFISVYDTVCEDRCLLSSRSLTGRCLYALEGLALRLADAVFLDTHAHAHRIEALFGLTPGSCGAVWVGVEHALFRPVIPEPRSGSRDAPLQVLFYGQFIPLHGINVIIDAARRLRYAPVEWVLVGRGQEAPRIRAELHRDPLPRLRWVEWVEYEQLSAWLAAADLCLGIFGTSGKAASVIPNKVFQIVAARRPLVTRDSVAIRELLQPCAPCTYLVPAGDGAALASAVQEHLRWRTTPDLRCHGRLAEAINAPAIGRQFVDFVRQRLGLWTTR